MRTPTNQVQLPHSEDTNLLVRSVFMHKRMHAGKYIKDIAKYKKKIAIRIKVNKML